MPSLLVPLTNTYQKQNNVNEEAMVAISRWLLK
jgi:hypothetical protein